MQQKKVVVGLFCIIFLFPLWGTAQSNVENVVYLKNGGILRGDIIERIEGEALKIKTAGRNVFVVNLDEIEKIREQKVPAKTYFKKSGYINNTGINLLAGSKTPIVSVRMVNGYQFTPQFSAGLGAGFVLYDDPLNLIPLFVDLKYKFLEANTTPFVSLKGGYSFSVLSDDNEGAEIESHSGGLMINPVVGIQFELNSNLGLYLTSGYNIEHASFEQPGWNGRTIKTDIIYRRVQFGVGLTF